MKTKLLLASTMALGLAAGAVPAFAQSTAAGTDATSNGAGFVQAQNYSQTQTAPNTYMAGSTYQTRSAWPSRGAMDAPFQDDGAPNG